MPRRRPFARANPCTELAAFAPYRLAGGEILEVLELAAFGQELAFKVFTL